MEHLESFNYLQKEAIRLQKIKALYTLKIKNLKNYPQNAQLIKQQEQERDEKKKELLDRVKEKDSFFFQFLEQEFKKIFPSSHAPQSSNKLSES